MCSHVNFAFHVLTLVPLATGITLAQSGKMANMKPKSVACTRSPNITSHCCHIAHFWTLLLILSAPAGLKVAVARPGDVSPLLLTASCPPPNSTTSSGNSSRSASSTGSVTLPVAPATITCTFNYTTSSPAAGLVGGVVVLPAAAGSSSGSNGSSSAADTSSPSFIGATQNFSFAAGNAAVTKQNLGDCVTAAELSGIEAVQGEDLLIPPVRTQNDIGLSQLWKSDASGMRLVRLRAYLGLRHNRA